MGKEPIEIYVEVKRETYGQDGRGGAILVNGGMSNTDVWLPKSLVFDRELDGKCEKISIPEWLAAKKGLI